MVQQALTGQWPLVMHSKLLAQYWDVLTRPEHRARLIYMPAQIEHILAALVGVVEEVTVRFLYGVRAGAIACRGLGLFRKSPLCGTDS
jgi:hypothetical protein